jgi:hypothetical protein
MTLIDSGGPFNGVFTTMVRARSVADIHLIKTS